MSNVDTVSLPAALDVTRNAFVTSLNSQPLSKPTSPKRQRRTPDCAVSTKADSVGDDDATASPKADSEAETIIQSGRESLSPEKRRKYIIHNPKRRYDGDFNLDIMDQNLHIDSQPKGSGTMDDNTVYDPDCGVRPSGPPQSVEPLPAIKIERLDELHTLPNKSDICLATVSLPDGEKGCAARKRDFSESAERDSEESRVHQLQLRCASTLHSRGRSIASGVTLSRSPSQTRSASPIRRSHARSTSGSQPSGNSQRAKNAPTTPAIDFQRHSSEDRQSMSSSMSGSSLPGSNIRRLASVDGASASPARPTGHKKQRDQNGRTRLARACAAQEYEAAVARLAERPEDLNVADNAGNTPLQIASLEGCASIVKILLDAGCEVETKNIDKDTPLIDAVENGHLDVVILLLEAGANPRTVNAEGDEPYDLVPPDTEDYEGIRRALAEAKEAQRNNRRSEDRAGNVSRDQPLRRPSAISPRESPLIGPRSPPFGTGSAKRKSVRSEATRNDLLWTKATPENLQQFAAKGDIAGVANILNVGQKADAESLIAATKGGHDEVLSLLLGMGDADPDPGPLENGNQRPGYNTPMLAAIGRGNLTIIKLLLDQPGFNPTRRMYRDLAYFELSRERRAENWEEEFELLKAAYDNYNKTKMHRRPDLSLVQLPRGKEKENKRRGRRESPLSTSRPRKTLESPSRCHTGEILSKDIDFPEERKRQSSQCKGRPAFVRAKPYQGGGSDESTSNFDTSRLDRHKQKVIQLIKTDDDRSLVLRDDEPLKRRRLIPGRPPQDHNRKMYSLVRPDPQLGHDDAGSPSAGSLKAAVGNSGSTPRKRIRDSLSPEEARSPDQDCDDSLQESQRKRRRVLLEGGTLNITNGGTKKSATYDSKLADVGRDTSSAVPPHEAKNYKSDRSLIKEEPRKHGTNELADIPMENTEDVSKKAETDAEGHSLADSTKVKEDHARGKKRLINGSEQAPMAEGLSDRPTREEAEDDERKRKEIERKRTKQVEDERQKRLEQERLRLLRMRREQEEQEQRRRDALPNRLREAANLIASNDARARSRAWLKKFMPVVTTDTRQLDTFCGADLADEKWVPNFLVAPLLATNDLQLSQYASWEKRNATPGQRMDLWRVTRRILSGTDDRGPTDSSLESSVQRDCETKPRFFKMEHIFWVKLSDFMDLAPHIPHLQGLDIKLTRMSVGQPPESPIFPFPRPNGYGFGSPPGQHSPTNGYSFPQPDTYV